MSDELPLALPRGSAPPADPLGRVFTPPAAAEAICRRLEADGVSPLTVTEPSVGGGAFVRAVRRVWPDAMTTGFDIDSQAEGLALVDNPFNQDWLARWDWEPDDLVVGNPPYVTRGQITAETCARHITLAVERGRVAALILPLPYLGQDWFNELHTPTQVWPLLPRPWDRVREVAVYVWGGERWTIPGRGAPVVRPLRWK